MTRNRFLEVQKFHKNQEKKYLGGHKKIEEAMKPFLSAEVRDSGRRLILLCCITPYATDMH